MSIGDSFSDEPRPAAIDKKKSYEKPGFRHEEVFVTSALSCGKSFDQGNCKFVGTKVS